MSDHAAALGPLVFPSGAGNHAGVFRTLLIGERCGELGVGADFLSETLLQKREDEFGEGDAYLAVVFGIFVVYQPRHVAGDALIVDAGFGGERFGAARKVAVLVCRRHAESKVALGIGAFERHRHGLRLAFGEKNIGVDPQMPVDFAYRLKVDVDEFKDAETPERLIRFVDVGGIVFLSGGDVAVLVYDARTQVMAVAIKDAQTFVVFHIVGRIFCDVVLACRVVVGDHIDVAHEKRLVAVVMLYAVGIRRHHVHCQVDGTASGCGVGSECDIFLVKPEIALVAQAVGDVLARLVEHVAVKVGVVAQNEFG